MKFHAILLAIFCSISGFGAVEKSVIPLTNALIIKDLTGKINSDQINEIRSLSMKLDESGYRIMSFNMLLNYFETHLEPIDRWENRKTRVIEYIQWAHPDVIGSQELQADQINDILDATGSEYGCYGLEVEENKDIHAVFFRKDRLELINAKSLYFSETPQIFSKSPFGCKNTFAFCHFKDKNTEHEFIVLNTHLAFSNIEQRAYEAYKLRDFLQQSHIDIPLFLTGDFNTFSFRQELDLPFYDGDKIVQIIEEGGVVDSSMHPLFGHFGTLSSTNFCAKQKKPFCSEGEPGIILDHIFVNERVWVLTHTIDPAQVDGHFPSDHFPVIIDCFLK